MSKKTVILLALACITASLFAQSGDLQEQALLRRAASVVPSARQYDWQRLETIAFVHFGMNTFTDREWGEGTEDPALFNPTALDARQWARVCKDAGLKMLIVTAKHHDGLCLWPSAYTDHSVKKSPWKGGEGDVVREVADACREYGLKFGFYLSPWDRHEPSYGDSPRYNAHFLNQLRELLTGYGEVSEVWFDGACGEGPNGKRQVYDFPAYYQLIRELQPNAVIAIMGPDVRWVGTEEGYARETEWSVLPAAAQNTAEIAASSQQQATDEGFIPGDRTGEDLGSRDMIRNAKNLVWYPAEADVSIRPGWFYHQTQDQRVKSPEKLLDIYYGSVGRNAVLLLNLPPDKRGLIHENDAAALREMRRILDATFAVNLLAGVAVTSAGGEKITGITDGSLETAWEGAAATPADPGSTTPAAPGAAAAGANTADQPMAVLTADLGAPRKFDLLLLQEEIRRGQRIEAFALQVPEGAGWRTVAAGTTVGYKRMLRFPPVIASRVRLLINRSRTQPVLAEWGLYLQPPSVAISPANGTFIDSLQVELTASDPEAAVHYTLDGGTPGLASPRYTAPLHLTASASLRAAAFTAAGAGLEQRGEFSRARFGLSLAQAYAPQYSGGGNLALLDGRSGSADFADGRWQGYQGVDLDAIIDLGEPKEIPGVTIGVLQDPASWIFFPESVQLLSSNDGVRYEKGAVTRLPAYSATEAKEVQRIELPLNKRARYLRLIAKNRGICPPGHPGAGEQAWLFADEITVGSAPPRALTLAAKGRSDYAIIVPQAATAAEKRAAALLQEYLKKSTGALLPIRDDRSPEKEREIVIGPGARVPLSLRRTAAGLPEDGFYLAASGEKIVLLGGPDRGAVYGAVHLLEKYVGCRIYAPHVEVVPPHRTLKVQISEELQKPANRFRTVYTRFAADSAYKEWMRLDQVEDIYARGYYVHTFDRLVPRAQYFASHPEYYCWMNGKRIHDQLCLTHPEVLRLTIDQLRREMAEQPDKKYWSVSQNDNFSYCQCPDCQKIIDAEESPAGPVIRFVNAVASAFPDKIISTLAYQFSRKAPRLARPLDNVHIVLCTIELNRSKPIENDPESQDFVRDIREWSQLTQNLYLWDYVVQFTNYVSPFPNLHVLQPNLQFFVRHNAFEHFQQANGQSGGEMAELKNWVIAKWLWNPDLDADSLKNDFLNGYFGPASPFVRAYIDLLEKELIRSGDRLDIYGSPVWHANSWLSAANVTQYNRLFDQAEAAVAGMQAAEGGMASGPELLLRVHTARMPLQFAMMEIGKNDLFGPRGWYEEREGKFHLRTEMRQILDKFYATGKAVNMRHVNESGFTLEDYYTTTLRFIDTKVEGNFAFRQKAAAEPPPSPKYAGGDMAVLTNGVQGASDYKVHWLGWEGVDFSITLDLGQSLSPLRLRLATLYDPKSWILHPQRVACQASADGTSFTPVGAQEVTGDQRDEAKVRDFVFTGLPAGTRFLRLEVIGTKHLPAWHPSEGGLSWVFIDELVVE